MEIVIVLVVAAASLRLCWLIVTHDERREK